jgi:GNAT superfamily N-acetyltransferase
MEGATNMLPVEISKGYTPGVIGRIVQLHAFYYSASWSFGPYFEAKVASDLSDFFRKYDESRDCLWIAKRNNRIVGSIAIEGSASKEEGAHLRWFIVEDSERGSGIGTRLMEEAMRFCGAKGYGLVYLWTFEGLDAARHIYEKAGFVLRTQRMGDQWGTPVKEQRFEFVGAGEGVDRRANEGSVGCSGST